MQCIQSSFYCHAHLHLKLTLSHCLPSNTNTFKLAGFASRFPRFRLTRSVAANIRRQGRVEPEWRNEEEEEEDYEDNVDAVDILLGDVDDPKKIQKQIEARIKKKQKTIFQTKTGSAEPMNVTFNNFDFSDSYIWIEFDRAPSDNDLRIVSGAMRSWFVLGHLGGYNSNNLQLTELPGDKQPSYDIIQANKDIEDAITFENIGDIEIQDNLARIWVGIGNSDPLTLDVLINALKSLSSDYIGIRELVFGGQHWGSWREVETSSQDKCKVWRI